MEIYGHNKHYNSLEHLRLCIMCCLFCTIHYLLGALIYLLNLFCNSTSPIVREQTAALLGKMIADKLVGPKVRIILTKFLPLIFMDAMKDNPEASVTMFESEYHSECFKNAFKFSQSKP